jgi:hypothetical protein
MPLTADELHHAWVFGDLVRLRPGERAPIAGDVRAFLSEAGLPAVWRCNFGSEGIVTFCRLAQGLASMAEESFVGPPLPLAYGDWYVLGDEYFMNGSALWCVHFWSGEVARIDVQLREPVEWAHSSVPGFAAALLATVRWAADRDPGPWPPRLDALASDLDAADPGCASKGFWAHWLDWAREEEPEVGAFRGGTVAEGEAALLRGPW